MRGFQQRRGAQVICDSHGFRCNLRDGFYRVVSRPATPVPPPRLACAWDDLTQILPAASLSLLRACVGVLGAAFRF